MPGLVPHICVHTGDPVIKETITTVRIPRVLRVRLSRPITRSAGILQQAIPTHRPNRVRCTRAQTPRRPLPYQPCASSYK